MLFIRQNATHKVVLGPAVSVSDGYTPVTNLAVSSADEAEAILHDNGTVVDISGYTFAAITTADGYYHLTLQTAISGTVGHLTIVVNDDDLILPLRADFTVLEEAIYDALFASSAAAFDANQRVDVGSWLGTAVTTSGTTGKPEVDAYSVSDDATAANNLESACDNYSATRGLAGTALPAVAAGGAGGIPTDSTGKTSFNDPTAAAIADAVLTESVDDHKGTANSLAEHLDEIQVDTNSLNDTKVPQTLNLTVSGNIGIDWANVENPGSTVDLAATDIQLCDTITTYTGNTPQTGDVYAALPTNFSDLSITVTTGVVKANDASGNAIAPASTALDNTTWTDARAGYLDNINGHTPQTGDSYARIGANGASLTALPWNSSWDAEVESEVNDAIDTAISELGVAAPTATPTLRTGLMLLYMALRNKLVVQTSGTDAIEVYNDAGTLICKKLITDDSSDYTEAEMTSG